MDELMRMVAEFHGKHDFPVGDLTPGEDPKTDMVRVHLIAEELGELALALAERDEVRAADALADLAYVTVGTAVAYGIPLAEVFAEVHRSNMTKAVRSPGDTRLRDKGASYQPADVAGVIRTARKLQAPRASQRAVRETLVAFFILPSSRVASAEYRDAMAYKEARSRGAITDMKIVEAGPANRDWSRLLCTYRYTVRGNSQWDYLRHANWPFDHETPSTNKADYVCFAEPAETTGEFDSYVTIDGKYLLQEGLMNNREDGKCS